MDLLLQAAEIVFGESSENVHAVCATPSVACYQEVVADITPCSPLSSRNLSAAETTKYNDQSVVDTQSALSVSFKNIRSSTPRSTPLQHQPSFALNLSMIDMEEAPLDLSAHSIYNDPEVPLNLVITPITTPKQCKALFHVPLNLAFGKHLSSTDDRSGIIPEKRSRPLQSAKHSRLCPPARMLYYDVAKRSTVQDGTMHQSDKKTEVPNDKENVPFGNNVSGNSDSSDDEDETPDGIIHHSDKKNSTTEVRTNENDKENHVPGDNDSDDDSVDDGDVTLLNEFSMMEYFEPYQINSVIEDEEVSDSEDLPDYPAAPGNDFGFKEHNECSMVKTEKRTANYNILKNRNLKTRGQEYMRPNGVKVAARRVKPACFCSQRKCQTKYSQDLRIKLLENFLKLTLSAQNQFLSNHISISPIKYHRVLNSTRSHSRKYYLPGIGGNVQVCKTMFLATFDVTEKKIRILATKKFKRAGVCLDDERMANSSHNRVSFEDKKKVEDHIKSFPLYTSHYGRERSDQFYLSSDLNITKIYDLYVQKCSHENSKAVHYNTFRLIFKTFNISFRRPQIDTCCECDKLHVLLKQSSKADEKFRLQAVLEAHQAKAQQVYDSKRHDVQLAKTEKNVYTASFDLQKCLPTPHLVCGQAFYSRQLYTLNLTVFETFRGENVGRCYLWDESKARRGSQEVGSCLLLNLRSLLKLDGEHEEINDLKTINLYSDRCSSQNHNIVICMTLALFAEECSKKNQDVIIRHNFMVSGHSHMEVDSIHASIERAKKKTTVNIETPRDYAIFISQVRRKTPLQVVEMKQSQFLALKNLDKRFKRPKLNDQGDPVRFKEIMVFEYRSKEIGKVFYKTDPMHEYRSFTILEDIHTPLPKLNPIETNPIPLSQEKLNDLKKLMPYISNKMYYETLLKSLSVPKRGRKKLTDELADDGNHFDDDLDAPEEAWPVEYLEDEEIL